MKSNMVKFATFVASLAISSVIASTQVTPESEQLLQRMQENIKSTLLNVAKIETAAGNNMENFYYQISIPEHYSMQFGMVLDFINGTEGLTVLSVSPGGFAQKIGIKVNDIILSIDDYVVNPTNYMTALKKLKDKQHESIRFNVAREDGKLQLLGSVEPLKIPSLNLVAFRSDAKEDTSSNCGRVSVFQLPRGSNKLYSATFYKINDRNLMTRDDTSYKLKPGKHTIFIKEQIQGTQITRNRNSRAKAIEITVEAGKQYALAAEFIPENRMLSFRNDYWRPALWKVTNRKCTL